MSSITASPGKENSMGGEKSAPTKELENLLNSAKEIYKNIVDSTTAKADLAMDSSDGSGFNVLGGDAPTVSQLVTNLELGMKLIKEHDQALSRNAISVIESLNRAKDITTSVQSLCNTISVLYNKLEDGSKITACFEKFSVPLAALLELVKSSKHFKDLVNIATQTSLAIMKRFETSSSGPYESSLLSSIEPFLICCINHTNPKLRLAMVTLWKATFTNSKELTYSDKLTPVLLAAAKRHSIFLPGLSSVESMEEVKTPSVKTPNTYKIRSAKKRLTLLDEDSVDYVPIAPSTSAKKMKLTDHQKEVFAATRDKIPLMDEDSRQPGSLPKSLAEQFDMEASQSGSQSNQAKKLVNETTALLTSTETPKEKEEPLKVVEPVETTGDMKEAGADKDEDKSKEIDEKKDEKKPDSPEEKVKTEKETSQSKEGSTERSDEVVKKKTRGRPSSAKPVQAVSETKVAAEKKPRARRSLKMTDSEEPMVKEDDAKESSDDVGSISSYVESSSETSQDSTEYVPQNRSRRSQAKGTPSKFVAKPRAVKNHEKTTKEETPKKKRGRKPKKSMEKEAADEQENVEEPKVFDEVEKESTDESVMTDKVEKEKADEVEKEKVDEPMEVEETKKNEQKQVCVEETNGAIASASEDEVQFIGEVIAVDSKDKSPEIVTTPMKKDDRLERPSSAIIRTPGILKKPGTPSTHERGHRVHFCSETVLNKEERNAIVATPKRAVETAEDRKRNNNPVFPELASCTEPVTKIIDKHLPYGAGSVLLRGALEQKKISTIGGLARATGKEISSLPVKTPRYDTVRSALTAFAISNGLLEAPEPAKENEVVAPSSPSPALQEAEKSPSQEKLKELELTTNHEDSVSSSSTFQKFLNDVKRVSNSYKESEKDIAGWSSNEIKQLLNTTNAAMTDLAECQKKLFARLV